MKIVGWFTVGLTQGSKELLEELLALHPEGRRRTLPRPHDGVRMEYFECLLPKGDPKLEELIGILTGHGYRLWKGRTKQERVDVLFKYRRIYEKDDFESAELLHPIPDQYVGCSNRSEGSLMLLDPVAAVINEQRNGLKPFEIGHTSPNGLIVSTGLKEAMETAALQRLVFEPILSKHNPSAGTVPGYWHLTSDLVLPPIANPELDDGFYWPPELHYRKTDLDPAGPFDMGLTLEQGDEIVSPRFYRFCVEQKLDMIWQPVRSDPDC